MSVNLRSYDTRGHLLTSSMWVGRGATPAKASATVTLSSTCTWDSIGRISGKTLSSSNPVNMAEAGSWQRSAKVIFSAHSMELHLLKIKSVS